MDAIYGATACAARPTAPPLRVRVPPAPSGRWPGGSGTLTPFHGPRRHVPVVVGDVRRRRTRRRHLWLDHLVARPRATHVATLERPSAGSRGVLMLTLLDLRERGGRLEPTKLEIDPATAETVREILQRVFVEGDEVLVELAAKFDGVELPEGGILVTDEEFEAASRATPTELRAALDELIERLRGLAARQMPREWWHEHDGVRYGEIVRPLRTVGCYVPGGRARY